MRGSSSSSALVYLSHALRKVAPSPPISQGRLRAQQVRCGVAWSLFIGTEIVHRLVQGSRVWRGGGFMRFPPLHSFSGVVSLSPGCGRDQVPTLLGYGHCSGGHSSWDPGAPTREPGPSSPWAECLVRVADGSGLSQGAPCCWGEGQDIGDTQLP